MNNRVVVYVPGWRPEADRYLKRRSASSYCVRMNLPFLKLRVADCPWIVFDRSSEAPGDELPWGPIAVDICSRSRGASAVGVIVLGRRDGRPEARTWDSAGEPRDPPPAALLCASRLLFDAGRAGPDSVSLRIPSGEAEVMVIDSRILGLSVGFPSREDGSSLGEAAGALGRGFSAPAGLCVAMPVRLGAETLEVVLFDSPPARKSVRRTASRVDALAVSRQELRVRRGTRDPLVAAAAALAAAVEADYADREASVIVGGDRLVAQWPEGGPVFVATAPEYCLSGEFWIAEPR